MFGSMVLPPFSGSPAVTTAADTNLTGSPSPRLPSPDSPSPRLPTAPYPPGEPRINPDCEVCEACFLSATRGIPIGRCMDAENKARDSDLGFTAIMSER
ncbi:unnamed protein product [Arctogadus glacialis]